MSVRSVEFREGLAARDVEQRRSDNPYDPGSREHRDWEDGWETAQAQWLNSVDSTDRDET